MKRFKSFFTACAVIALVALASPRASTRDGAAWVFGLAGQGNFFDLPYPTNLRLQSGGKIMLDDFPKVLGLEMAERAREAVSRGYGFSTAPTVYFRFTGPIDETKFPCPAASRMEDSPLFLIDIDPASPDHGKRFPLLATFYKKGPSNVPRAENLLAFMPFPGFVLRENTRYAAGVIRALGNAQGGQLAASPEIAAMARGETPPGRLGAEALALYAPALAELEALGVKADDLAALTVFTTGSPSSRGRKIFDSAIKLRPQLIGNFLTKTREYELFTVLRGELEMPQFQDGLPPFGKGRGGRIQFDSAGNLVVQRTEKVPFCIAVPKGKMPAEGFPLMVYIHGTAGVAAQFIDRGEVPDDGHDPDENGIISGNFGKHEPAPLGAGPAMVLAKRGIASAGAAQPVSGERGGRPDQLSFYNFLSPEALRDNLLQAVAEAAMFTRFLEELEIDPSLVPGTDSGGGKVKFNSSLVFGMGQSLGSLILGPWGAVETDLKALIPAGNGAYWSLFMAQGNALDMKRLRDREEGLMHHLMNWDKFHPLIMLMSSALAPADPFAYQGYYLREPLPGRQAKHVWASFGLYDHYFWPDSQNAAMMIMGLDFAGEVQDPSTKPALELAGLKFLDFPVSLNKDTPAGKVTAVAMHFQQKGVLDGHHVNYQRDDAKYSYGCFLYSLVQTGAPVAYPLKDQWDAECGP